ncbi:MAG: ShlB/FhaC/HecB family hemolysin secretion/activation protein [Verrucomicrobia bacterium]|nr:ShlB/FhaC/HecB family hemolysin secretion/activation protein [Verrucomicrobiota bacterium]
MIKKFWLAPILLCSELVCGGLMAADNPPTQQQRTSNAINGIFLTSDREDVIAEGRPDVTGIRVHDFRVPGGDDSLIEILRPFLGMPLNKKTAIEIKQKIMKHYVAQGMSMIGVEIPAQRTRGGVIQILVKEKQFGRAIFRGKAIYSNEKLRTILAINPQEQIAENVLRNNLSWINRNNFQSVQMRFVPTTDPDVVDIEFNCKSRSPFRFYAKGDNTGSASTGYGRLAAGVNWGNAFFIGDLLSLEYKTSNQFRRFQNYNVNWVSFLPHKDVFSVYATYAKVKPASPRARITSKSWQVRPRYTILFLPLFQPFQQTLSFEYDIKFSNSNVINLAGAPTVQQVGPPVIRNIYVTEFLINYIALNKIGIHSLNFNAGVTISAFTFLPYQSRQVYNRNRANSVPRFVYLSLLFGDVMTFCNESSISILLRAQLAPHTIPSTELFSVGGYSTVRGYHQSEASGDNGFIANFEWRTPELKFFPKNKGRLTALGFVDYGISNNLYVKQSNRPGAKRIPHTQYLLGVGPGLRYYVGSYFQLRFDYGIKLHKLFSNSPQQRKLHDGFGQVHIGAMASF